MTENLECTITVLETLIQLLENNPDKKVKISKLYHCLDSLKKDDIQYYCMILHSNGLIQANNNSNSRNAIASVTRVTQKGMTFYAQLQKTGPQKVLDFCKKHFIIGLGELIKSLPSLLLIKR